MRREDPNGRFIVAATKDPRGYQPGIYFYVVHMATGNKVSRYLRRIGSAASRADKYARWYALGDRDWPPVDRCDELATNPQAVPTFMEFVRAHFHVGCAA